jgi:hypothetical protein
MRDFWESLSSNAKFSIIAFFVVAILGLFSMGLLGALLYYPVSFLFKDLPPFNTWHGDWVWPATISVGIFWSLGFILGGFSYHYLIRMGASKVVLYSIYALVLWLWAAFLWYLVISNQEYFNK